MAQNRVRTSSSPKNHPPLAHRPLVVGQSLPRSTKKPRTIVPPPQSQRIMQRYADGQSIREISRREGRARETVTRIVRSDEMQTFVNEMRERFYGLGCDAMDAIRHTLRQKKDGQLGYRLLTDIGVIPTEDERRILTPQPMSVMLNVNQEEQDLAAAREMLISFADMAVQTHKLFGMEMPEMDAVKQMLAQKKEKMRISPKSE